MKTVGILGGMGPFATAAFFRAVLDATPASKDWEHLRIVIDNNPHIPSRSRHLLYGEESPVKGMVDSCQKLQDYPVDFIALPCNSAAYFLDQVQPHVRVPVLNICQVAVNALVDTHPGVRRVAALGGHVTYTCRTYAPHLAARGLELVDHGRAMQDRVEAQIEALKLNQASAASVQQVLLICADLVRDFRVDAVIMACTEFGCLPPLEGTVPVVDSSRALALHTVALARG